MCLASCLRKPLETARFGRSPVGDWLCSLISSLQGPKVDQKTGSQYPVLGPKAIVARSLVTHKNQEGACAATGGDLGPEVEKGAGLGGGDTAVFHLH